MALGKPGVAASVSNEGSQGMTPPPGAMDDRRAAAGPHLTAGRQRQGVLPDTSDKLLADVSGGWQ